MLAIFEVGGKQYKATEGSIIKTPKIQITEDSPVLYSKNVLCISDGNKTSFGDPYLKDATVEMEFLKSYREKKIIVFKKKRRKDYKRKFGYRENSLVFKVTSIKR